MKRREFIALVSGAAASLPFAALAQAAKPTIGVLGSATAEGWAPFTAALRSGLAETGYVEGQNLSIDYRWADGRYDRLPALAAELVGRQPSAIVAFTTPAAVAAKAATSSIPIVFTTIGDPVRIGLVSNLSRPDSNVTGVASLNVQIGPKRLELMHELLPTLGDIAVLINPGNPTTESQLQEMQVAANTLRVRLHLVRASSESEFGGVFSNLRQSHIGGLVIGGDPLFSGASDRLAAMALQQGMPAIYQGGTFAAAGGIMDYGGDYDEPNRLAGVYTGRILKGEKPADLPVQQASKVRLIVNLKTAKALGLTVPLALLGRADEVIE